MDQFKIDNFLTEHNRPFPGIRALSPEECLAVRTKICRAFKLDQALDNLRLLQEMTELSSDVGENACDQEFSLSDTLRTLGVMTNESLLINWDRFSHIDEISASDLSVYFTDIWYPSSDDIELFDRNGGWFLMIKHWGALKLGAAR